MDKAKREKLEKVGMIVTDSAEWLELDAEEAAIVDMRANLAREVERLRKEQGMTQKDLAERIGTKQPGVARMLKTPSTSTLDALVKALLKLGSTPRRIAALF